MQVIKRKFNVCELKLEFSSIMCCIVMFQFYTIIHFYFFLQFINHFRMAEQRVSLPLHTFKSLSQIKQQLYINHAHNICSTFVLLFSIISGKILLILSNNYLILQTVSNFHSIMYIQIRFNNYGKSKHLLGITQGINAFLVQ